MNLELIEQTAADCGLCELHRGRTKSVFAKGSDASRIIVCGMCPGPEENKVGIPFVGTAGKILDEVLLKAFGNYSSSLDVYVTNLVKCFVTPGIQLKPHWMESCLPYFLVQISLIKPRVLIALGKDVNNFLLNNTLSMGKMRGNVYNFSDNIKLISTYHPSYLNRGGGVKHQSFGDVVNDFKKAKEIIDMGVT